MDLTVNEEFPSKEISGLFAWFANLLSQQCKQKGTKKQIPKLIDLERRTLHEDAARILPQK